LSITAEDAGTALKILGVIDDVVGGKLTITGTALDNDPKRAIRGRAEVSAYRLVNQSALVRLLTIAAFPGIVDAMTGRGFQMYRFEADFTKTGGRIDVPLARTWGPLSRPHRHRLSGLQHRPDQSPRHRRSRLCPRQPSGPDPRSWASC